MSGSQEAHTKVELVFMGLYGWEILTTLNIEWQLITRKRAFTVPMAFYLLNKYFFLGAMIAGQVQDHNSTHNVNCTSLYKASIILGNMSLGLASVNLAIRTFAIWDKNRYIIAGLSFLILVNWIMIIIQGNQIHSEFYPGIGCGPPSFDQKLLTAILVYSLCFDGIVCFLNMYKLGTNARNLFGPQTRTLIGLARVVLVQGLTYFVISFFINISIIVMLYQAPFWVFSTYIAVAEGVLTIVACRAVRNLSGLLSSDNNPVHAIPTANSVQLQHTTMAGSGHFSNKLRDAGSDYGSKDV